jgi:hypothetical protein
MDVYSVFDSVTLGMCLPSRCLAVVICVTVCYPAIGQWRSFFQDEFNVFTSLLEFIQEGYQWSEIYRLWGKRKYIKRAFIAKFYKKSQVGSRKHRWQQCLLAASTHTGKHRIIFLDLEATTDHGINGKGVSKSAGREDITANVITYGLCYKMNLNYSMKWTDFVLYSLRAQSKGKVSFTVYNEAYDNDDDDGNDYEFMRENLNAIQNTPPLKLQSRSSRKKWRNGGKT